MTDEEALKFYEALIEEYGDRLPNFEHCPREFAYFVMLYKYSRGLDKPSDM
jgi:hypothetical protein